MADRRDDSDNYYAEAAAQEIFSGPTHELIPSSYSSFHHHHHRDRSRSRSRSQRRESLASRVSFDSIYSDRSQALDDGESSVRRPSDSLSQFQFFSREEVKQSEGASTVAEDEPDAFDSAESLHLDRGERTASERGSHSHAQRPFFDQFSDDEPLLGTSGEPAEEFEYPSARMRQKYYIAEEDLVIVCAGYRKVQWRRWAYYAMCFFTCGLGYLFLRWFPRWRISWLAQESALGNCDLLVIENQWGDLEFLDVKSQRYNQPLSTIFNLETLAAMEDDDVATPSLRPQPNPEDSNDPDYYVDKDPNVPFLHTVSYRFLRFYYNPVRDLFMTNADWVNPTWTSHELAMNGLDSEVQDLREIVFGPNSLDIPIPSTTKLLADEVLHPFYIFQVFSIILWAFDDFMYYATAIFIVSVASVLEALYETKKNFARLSAITAYDAEVRILRSGFLVTVPSSELLPGDVYELSDPSLQLVPCDSVLLSGDCIVNESILTGESVPVSKVAADDDTLESMVHNGPTSITSSFLYGGTKLIRVRKPPTSNTVFEGSLAMAVRTGFTTTKGSLVRSMLFPRPSTFKFYRDSFRYIGVMAIIAVLGFLVSLVSFIKMKLDVSLIIMRALDLITIAVPPALPATLTIGTNISLARLRKKQIFCITPTRTNVSGRIDVVCFDKTGTLTEDGLDVLGVHFFDNNEFSPLLKHVSEMPDSRLLDTLATCHELREVNKELIGDPLDLKMFDFCGWKFTESEVHGNRASKSPDGKVELNVAKQFEFVSKLRRMSVVVTSRATGTMLLVKGAPEVMRDICRPGSIPANFDNLLHEYTHRGYRVIACAWKSLDTISDYDREELEKDLEFNGFIIFENRLKPSTTGVIKQLSQAEIRTIMCTGDNLLTAISVGRECHIVAPNASVYAAHFTENPQAPLRWECVDNPNYTLDDETLQPLGRQSEPQEFTLAITGEVFGWLIEHGTTHQLEQMLLRGSIYARMSPDEKHELVSKLQMIDYTTCFCGDGANDVGALKQADVGASLSEAEASVAAPFTSRVFEITCVIEIIREGRCALTTSFSCFQFMSMYSAIQFITVSILYSYGSNIGDFQFLWIDLFLIIPLAMFMAWSGPSPVLTKSRPEAKLVGRQVLVPLLSSVILVGIFLCLAWANAHAGYPWYIAPDPGNNSNLRSTDNTALFYVSSFQYIMIAWLLCRGLPYRLPKYTNVPFLITVLVCGSFTLAFIFLDPSTSLGRLLDLSPTDTQFKFVTIGIVILNFLVMEIADTFVFGRLQSLVGGVCRYFGMKQSQERYKALLEATPVV